MLAIEKEDRFVRFHAAQSIVFWVASIPVALLSAIPGIGILFSIAFFAVWVFLMYEAWTNREFEIPYLGAIARGQVFGDEDGSEKKDRSAPEPGHAPRPPAQAEGEEEEDPQV
jgi:uncharacterized membrane protein